MQSGISSWFGYKLSLANRLQLIANTGFRVISIWLGEEESLVAAHRTDAMAGMARDARLAIDNFHAPFTRCNLLWSDSSHEQRLIVQEYHAYLAFCRQHDVPILVVHLTHGNTPPPLNKQGIAACRDLVKAAEDSQVILAVENCRRPDYVDAVFEEIASDYLGFCYDSSHDALWGRPPGAILKKWRHLLVTTHFADNAGEHDDHWLPGEGTIDWEQVAAWFPVDTYSGTLLLEVVPKAGNPPPSAQEFLQQAFQTAHALRQRLETYEERVK